tara:strand:+ start:2637 stop:3746 length:1110 start_codon:yes stop_codon:yes gene_type:complete
MADLYADQVASIGEKIKSLQQNSIENYDDMAQTITSKYNKLLSGYDTKWKSVQDAGEEDIAGILGAKGVYKSGKKVYEGFKNIGKKKPKPGDKDKPDGDGDDTNTPDTSAPDGSAGSGSGAGNNPNANAQQQPQPDPDASSGGGGVDAPDPALGGGGGGGGGAASTPDATPTPATSTAPNPQAGPDGVDAHPDDMGGDLVDEQTDNLAVSSMRGGAGPADLPDEAEGFFRGLANRFYQSAGQKGQQIKSFFSRSAGDTAGDAAGGDAAAAAAAGTDAAAAAGGSGAAATFTTGEAVLGAIPGVGEIALALGGLVAIGEGIYHLFHHPKAPAAPPEIAPLQAPQALLQKYSAALPSVDSSVDRAASVSSF